MRSNQAQCRARRMQSHLKECSQCWKKLDWNRFPLSELLHLYSFALQWTAWLKNVQVRVHLDGNATKIAMTHWNIGVDSDWCYIYVKSEQPILSKFKPLFSQLIMQLRLQWHLQILRWTVRGVRIWAVIIEGGLAKDHTFHIFFWTLPLVSVTFTFVIL